MTHQVVYVGDLRLTLSQLRRLSDFLEVTPGALIRCQVTERARFWWPVRAGEPGMRGEACRVMSVRERR